MARPAGTSRSTPPPGNGGKPLGASVRETFESIVIAFVLAFVFRAFILEAYVIPTGSMATTLYGEQVVHTCSSCGYEFARGINTVEKIASLRNPGEAMGLRCPNCDTLVDHIPPPQIRSPNGGDRILVQKWPWIFSTEHTLGPKRWDVTVFKDPRDGTTNFIKRLIGKPGEVLEIIDGDIYTAPIETLQKEDPELLAALEALTRHVQEYGREYPEVLPTRREDLHQLYRRLNQRLLPFLRIAPKAERAQKSLWFNVYDHDYLPAAAPSGRPPAKVGWEPIGETAAKAWDTSQREIRFESDADALQAIAFSGKPIDDFVAYNYMETHGRVHNLVGDIRLRFTWLPEAGDGQLVLRLNRDRDTFEVELHPSGLVRLAHTHADTPSRRDILREVQRRPAFTAGQAVSVELANVDFRVRLKLNGEPVLATTDEQYRPDLERIMRFGRYPNEDVRPTHVALLAQRLRCGIRHLTLDRDVYYRSVVQSEQAALAPDGSKVYNPYYKWPGWGTCGYPILLRPPREVDGQQRPGEFFMLGDNSPASKDSRLWWEVGPHLQGWGTHYQIGTVPADQLIGEAFFVYWPSGYRPSWAGGIGIIPNFGRMRWIR